MMAQIDWNPIIMKALDLLQALVVGGAFGALGLHLPQPAYMRTKDGQ